MDKLNKTFVSEQVLTANEMNGLVGKINELVENFNQSQSGFQYIVTIGVNGSESTSLYFLQSKGTAVVDIKPYTEVYNVYQAKSEEYVSASYLISVDIDRGNQGEYTPIVTNRSLSIGGTLSVDIFKVLSVTQSTLRITVTETNTGTRKVWMGTAQLTTMAMTPLNVRWHDAFVGGSTYNFGPFSVVGSLPKVVHLAIKDSYGDTTELTDNIGTNQYSTGYEFRVDTIPESGTGVYQFEIWVSSGIMESEHYTYNIMCVKESEKLTASLVCVNDIGKDIVNSSNNYLLSYATYNGGDAEASPTLILTPHYGNADHEPITNTLSVSTEEKHALNYSVDISTSEVDTGLWVRLVSEDGENYAEHYFDVDNSATYPATGGAIFYMNPATRLNSQGNRTSIVNEMANSKTESSYTATWTKMAFVDGMDGWTTDNEGRSCLAVNAGSKVDIPYKPFYGIGNYGAFEITYKASVVSDYSENIITIATNPEGDNFVGIRIRPNEVCVHTKLTNNSSFDKTQNYKLQDEEVINLVVAFTRNYLSDVNGKYYHFCHIFVNGTVKREFTFEAEDNLSVNANIVLGSNTADLYVYGMRYYDSAFGFPSAFRNYVASLPTLSDKSAESERDAAIVNDSNEVNYEDVVSSPTANWFIMEMNGDKNTIPEYSTWTKKQATTSILEMHYGAHPTWSWRLVGVETSGQGTTSMNYYRWNFRWRIDKSADKKCEVSYWDGTAWTNTKQSRTVRFDGEHKLGDNLIEVKRITAKKNYASSQQSHKMGTTAAYNDLHDRCVGANESGGRTAVFQYPAYGFERTRNEDGSYSYRYIGLYTIGPDKGDKPTFAYDKNPGSLISAEGLDHNIRLCVFRYPWNEQVRYVGSQESVCICKSDTEFEKGWEIGNCCDLDKEADIEAALTNEADSYSFKRAYNMAYLNSPFIMGVSLSSLNVDSIAAALAKINSDTTTFGATPNVNDNDRPYRHYELYFDGEYDLYFLDVKDNQYRKTGINILEDLGLQEDSELDASVLSTLGYTGVSILSDLTLVQKDGYFRELRRIRFKAAMAADDSPWDLQDSLFCHAFLTIFGATDNHAKNSYPYRMTGKWRWRQDDLDTIFSTDNQGHDAKTYSVEFKDWSDSQHTAYVYKGEDSAFWTLIEQCYPEQLRTMGYSILEKMAEIGDGNSTYEKVVSFFNKYYWNNAQKFFAKSAYNHDAVFTYEEAFKYFQKGYSVDVNPLLQSHGDGLEAEQNWVMRRVIYCMSKYRFGPFYDYTDKSLGVITFRTQDPQEFIFTPSMDLYPCVLVGQGTGTYGARTFDNEQCHLDALGGANTVIYITGADYLRDLGDLSQIKIDAMQSTSISISAKRLEALKVGEVSRTKAQNNALTELKLENCLSLLSIDARNTYISGSLDLSSCPRIREVLLGGSEVTGIKFAEGCKVESVQLSPDMTSISFKNLKFLSDVTNIQACAKNVESIFISGCDALNALKILHDVYYSNSGVNELRYIRITDLNLTSDGGGIYDVDDPNGEYAEMLYRIAAGLDAKGNSKTYYGLSSDGQPDTSISAVMTGFVWFESMISGYRDFIINYFQNRLEIEVRGDVTPSAATINFKLTGEEWIFDNEIGVNGKYRWFYELSASSEYYQREVTWDFTGVPSNITPIPVAANGVYGVYLDLSEYVISEQNMNSQLEISFTVRSNVNSHVSLTKSVKIAGFAITGITLSASSETLSITQGETSVVTLSFQPSNQTKARFAQLVYDDSLLGYNEANSELYIKEGVTGYNVTEIYAKVGTGEYEVVSNKKTLYLNDQVIIYTAESPGFTDLLSYIKNTLKVSEFADRLTGREASRVTSIGTHLRNKTDITSFLQFEYFTGIASLTGQSMYGMTALVSIKFPSQITEAPAGFFENCTSLSDNGGNTEILSLTSLEKVGSNLFRGCSSLKEVYMPNVNSGSFYSLFKNCTNLEKVTLGDSLDTIESCEQMFAGCKSLKTVSEMRLPSLKVIYSMFDNCSSLTSVPSGVLDSLAMVTNASYCFRNTGIVEFPDISLPGITTTAGSISGMFRDSVNLEKIGNISIPNYAASTTLQNCDMFYSDRKLSEVGNIDVSSYENEINSTMFNGTAAITKIGVIICPKATSCVWNSNVSSLTDFGGFRDCKCNINCSSASKLTRQSALNIINECGNTGGTSYTITFHANVKALLTENDIALATAKGYTIA